MDKVLYEWRLAGWAENTLAVLLGLALAGLAFWLVLNAIKDVLDRATRYEKMRKRRNEKALAEWMETYREEHALRIAAEQRAEEEKAKAAQERNLRKQLAKGAKHD